MVRCVARATVERVSGAGFPGMGTRTGRGELLNDVRQSCCGPSDSSFSRFTCGRRRPELLESIRLLLGPSHSASPQIPGDGFAALARSRTLTVNWSGCTYKGRIECVAGLLDEAAPPILAFSPCNPKRAASLLLTLLK